MLPGNIPEVFLDTDVAFDILSKREPHYHSSIKLLHLASEGKIHPVISENCLANLIYLTCDIYKIADGISKLIDLVSACSLALAEKQGVLNALKSNFSDKENALQYHAALHHRADYFITRNLKDYKHREAVLPVYSPKQFIDSLPGGPLITTKT